jgi:nicotinate-nucleotide adenylyltransferase
MGIFVNPDSIEFVYGGTFDPFHNAHEAICHHVLAQTETDTAILRIIPCARPALKPQAQASDVHRLAMLQVWRDEQSLAKRILIDDIEMKHDVTSYTADTISRLVAQQKKVVNRIWVLGADAFNSLSEWHKVSILISQVNFWVVSRAGETGIKNSLGLKRVASMAQLRAEGNGAFWFDEAISIPVASSDIRQHINQQPLPVPRVIADYIEQHELYAASAAL